MGPTFLMVCVVVVTGWCCLPADSQTVSDGPLLSTFKEVTQRESRGPLGSYQFSFSLPQQERVEQRDEQGKVTGKYSFVDKLGNEVSVNYDADHAGYRARSGSLPQPPQDTPDVAEAKEKFLRHYERTVQLLKVYDSEESGSSEEDSEDEDSDESEESDENESDDDSSSEEGEYSDEEEDDDDDEEEEEGEEEEEEDENEEGDDNVRRREYKEGESEKEGEEGEEEEDERERKIRLMFEKALPGQPNVPVAIPVSLTQKTARQAILSPSFLLQPRLEQTNLLHQVIIPSK